MQQIVKVSRWEGTHNDGTATYWKNGVAILLKMYQPMQCSFNCGMGTDVYVVGNENSRAIGVA